MSDLDVLLVNLRHCNVRLWEEDGRLRYRAPRGAMTPELAEQLRLCKAELLQLLVQLQESTNRPIPAIGNQKHYELSHAQRRMWALSQLDDGSAAYNIPLHQVLEGPLNVDALQQSIARCAERHESLRTSIVMVDGEPRQTVHEQVDAGLHFIDLSDRADPFEAARKLAQAHARQPFDLERGWLFRAALAKLDKLHHVLLFTIHHIVCDGVSIGILVRELTRFYEAIRRGEPGPYPPLRIQYRDYADWQNRLMQSGALAIDRDWWLGTLRDVPPVLELPTDFPRPALQTFEGRELSFHLAVDKLEALRLLGRRHNASLFMTLLATLYILLDKYTGQADLVVGSPVAGRTHPDLENQIGLYLNTIALRIPIAGEVPFENFLKQVRQATAAAFDHQSYPFDQLLNELNVARDLSRNPLFDVTIILQNQDDPWLAFDEITVRPFVAHTGTSKTDLTFNFSESPSGLTLAIEYNTDLFVNNRIARMGGHFCQLLDDILGDPRKSIGALNMLTVEETRELLDLFNATSRPYPSEKTVVDLFEQQVRRKPDAVAVQCEEAWFTYRQLADRVDQLARHLYSLGVSRNVLVGVCMDRGFEMVAAVLAVMKAGGAYVPLDPSFPRERLAFMLTDSQAPVLLTQQALVDGLPQSQAHVVCLDADQMACVDGVADFASDATSESLAYVIYTSGSTGQPKGVEIPHRALSNFLCSMAQDPGLTEDDVLLAVTTLSFDIAGLEIFLPLTQGAQLIVASSETAADGVLLLETLDRCGATVMQATPATWRMLLAAGWRGSLGLKILCGGEALPRELATELLERGGSVWNLYGPTETTIWSALSRVKAGPKVPALEPIGRPIANTALYILDRWLQPVPEGVRGDLYIGSEGVARGYLRRPALTAERFLPNPFDSSGSNRIYQTGDIARYLPDGTIEFLGRRDHQVKIRGYRIELGEIEAVLATHSAVREVAVIARAEESGAKHLVAYIVPREGASFSALEMRSYLAKTMPDYMVPSICVLLEALPLTPNGKINRLALPLPAGAMPTSLASAHVAPRDAVEQAIAKLWQEVLKVETLGVYDDFFTLGGHSLRAAKVIALVKRDFGVSLTLREFFASPTIAQLADLTRSKQSKDPVLKRAGRIGKAKPVVMGHDLPQSEWMQLQ